MRLLIPALLLAGPAGAFTISTVDRDAAESPAFAVAGGKVTEGPLAGTPLEDLVQVVLGPGAPSSGKVEVRLSTGDLFWGDPVQGPPDGFALETASLGRQILKLDQIQSLVFTRNLGGAALAVLQDRMAADRAGMEHDDYCYLASGDRVRFLLRSVDALAVKGEDAQGRAYAFPLSEVQAVSLLATSRPSAAEGGVRVRLTTRDGCALLGDLKTVDAAVLSLEHPLLGSLSVPLDRCASLDFLNGRVQGLSEMDPLEALERPFLYDPARPPGEATVFRWRRDRQVIDGRPLSLRGRTYPQGLGVHAYCELTYSLGARFDRFRADVGIDDSARGGGCAEVLVKVDGRERFRARVTGKDPPQRVEVDCRGGERLTLVVDFGEEREVLDRVAWAGAVLVRRR